MFIEGIPQNQTERTKQSNYSDVCGDKKNWLRHDLDVICYFQIDAIHLKKD